MPAQRSEPCVCFGCDWVRNTALERKWSPPISGSSERFGLPHVGVADDGQVVAVGFERAQRVVRHEREVAAGRLGREQVLGRAPVVAAGEAVHLLDADQPRAIQRGGVGAACRPAGTIASRNGNATVAPTPRRKVRRGMCFPVMKSISRLLSLLADGQLDVSARFIWNASLLITPRMNDDIRYSFASAALAIARIAG